MSVDPRTDRLTGLRVTTDKSVDCHSLASIVAGVCGAGMSDQDKAIALFHFVRRMMFHYPQRSERHSPRDDLDALRLINTYGYSFCSQQAMTLVSLWRAAGIDGITWGVPGHCTAQAEYGGGLHWFDPLIGAYVFGRDGQTVASLADIAADPAVLSGAVADGRAGRAFLPCGKVLRWQAEKFCQHDPAYVKQCRDLSDDATFMIAVAAKAERAFDPPEPTYDPDITLRRGESVVFLWDHLDGQYNVRHLAHGEPPRQDIAPLDTLPPHHFCGVAAERWDEVNWPYWRPYEKTVRGIRTCRYQANGRHTYVPGLTDVADRPGVLEWRMRTPHVYTGAMLTMSSGQAFVSCDGRQTWTKVRDVAAGPSQAEIPITEPFLGRRDVWWSLEPATADDSPLRVECIFQHNMFARPFLVPGANRVTVAAAGGRIPVTVTWRWEEGGADRQDCRTLTALPADYTIDVGGADMPRMLSLELAAGKAGP
jgi:hypothetical protein